MPVYLVVLKKTDACFDISDTNLSAVSIGGERLMPILLPLLLRKSVGDTDSDTATVLPVQYHCHHQY